MRPRMSQGSDADGVGSRIQGGRSARLGPEERAPWAAGSRKVSAAGPKGVASGQRVCRAGRQSSSYTWGPHGPNGNARKERWMEGSRERQALR